MPPAMGASYFLTVHHKDLEGEGRAPYVWGIKQQQNAMNAPINIPAEMMEVLTNRMREIAQTSKAVEITRHMSIEERNNWLFGTAIYTLCGFQNDKAPA